MMQLLSYDIESFLLGGTLDQFVKFEIFFICLSEIWLFDEFFQISPQLFQLVILLRIIEWDDGDAVCQLIGKTVARIVHQHHFLETSIYHSEIFDEYLCKS